MIFRLTQKEVFRLLRLGCACYLIDINRLFNCELAPNNSQTSAFNAMQREINNLHILQPPSLLCPFFIIHNGLG